MAARPLLLGLASATRSRILTTSLRNAPRRSFCASTMRPATAPAASTTSPVSPAIDQSRQVSDPGDEAKNAAFLGEADSDDGFEAGRLARGDTQESIQEAVARNAAFLGEADSNDGFEARKAELGDSHEPIDPSAAINAAYLGEADSNDGFEALRAEQGDRYEAIDPATARNAAFLGEADSDDGFEADIEVNPDKHAHKIEDASESGFHGEQGEAS